MKYLQKQLQEGRINRAHSLKVQSTVAEKMLQQEHMAPVKEQREKEWKGGWNDYFAAYYQAKSMHKYHKTIRNMNWATNCHICHSFLVQKCNTTLSPCLFFWSCPFPKHCSLLASGQVTEIPQHFPFCLIKKEKI